MYSFALSAWSTIQLSVNDIVMLSVFILDQEFSYWDPRLLIGRGTIEWTGAKSSS